MFRADRRGATVLGPSPRPGEGEPLRRLLDGLRGADRRRPACPRRGHRRRSPRCCGGGSRSSRSARPGATRAVAGWQAGRPSKARWASVPAAALLPAGVHRRAPRRGRGLAHDAARPAARPRPPPRARAGAVGRRGRRGRAAPDGRGPGGARAAGRGDARRSMRRRRRRSSVAAGGAWTVAPGPGGGASRSPTCSAARACGPWAGTTRGSSRRSARSRTRTSGGRS